MKLPCPLFSRLCEHIPSFLFSNSHIFTWAEFVIRSDPFHINETKLHHHWIDPLTLNPFLKSILFLLFLWQSCSIFFSCNYSLHFFSGSQHNLHMENHNGHGYAKKMNNSMVKKNLVSVQIQRRSIYEFHFYSLFIRAPNTHCAMPVIMIYYHCYFAELIGFTILREKLCERTCVRHKSVKQNAAWRVWICHFAQNLFVRIFAPEQQIRFI